MTKQVEIFKTNIDTERDATAVVKKLTRHFPHCRVNFDLEDCDRILRIEAQDESIDEQQIIQLMRLQGFTCAHLL